MSRVYKYILKVTVKGMPMYIHTQFHCINLVGGYVFY
jgi:hypothetical protein